MIRRAVRADAARILEIYAPYIRETAITFEYEVPEITEFQARFDAVTARFPWIVWEEAGQILGYAYADAAFERKAYAWDADLSIYLDRSARGRGIGSKLYACMESLLMQMGYCNLYALVMGANEASMRFHEARGYEKECVMKKTGWKLGQWHDVVWYVRRLREMEDPGDAPKPFVCTPQALEIMARYSEGEE